MPKNFIHHEIRHFTGLDEQNPPQNITDHELTVCKNLDTGFSGELIKRTGFRRLTEPPGPIGANLVLGVFEPFTELLVFGTDITGAFTAIYTSQDLINWTRIALSTGAGEFDNTISLLSYAGKAYIYGSSPQTIRSWDGVTLTNIPTSPSATTAVIHKERMFVADNTAIGKTSRLFYSAIGDPTSWPATNFIDINPGVDADGINAIVVLRDVLYVFKEKTIWAVHANGSPINWVVRQVSDSVGVTKPGAAIEIDGHIFFGGFRGVYEFNGASVSEISVPIHNAIVNNVVSFITKWEDSIIVKINTGTNGFRYFVWNIKKKNWVEYVLNAAPASQFSVIFNAVPVAFSSNLITKGLYCTVQTVPAGLVKLMRFEGQGASNPIYTDDSVAVTVTFVSKHYSSGLVFRSFSDHWERYKRFLVAAAEVQGTGTMDYSQVVESVTTFVETVSLINGIHMYKMPGPGFARIFAVKLVHTSTTPFTIYGLALETALKRSLIDAAV